MLKSAKRLLVLAVVTGAFSSGCASWTPVAYTPNPAAVTNPAEDFERLAMTPKRFRPTKIEMHDSFATLIYAGAGVPGGVQSVPVPFGEIEQITLVTDGAEFAVRAMDGAGVSIYEYVATDQKKAQEMIDALTALVKAPTAPDAPAAPDAPDAPAAPDAPK